jgi:hypothetical protein
VPQLDITVIPGEQNDTERFITMKSVPITSIIFTPKGRYVCLLAIPKNIIGLDNGSVQFGKSLDEPASDIM